jgi:hypothetical protein
MLRCPLHAPCIPSSHLHKPYNKILLKLCYHSICLKQRKYRTKYFIYVGINIKFETSFEFGPGRSNHALMLGICYTWVKRRFPTKSCVLFQKKHTGVYRSWWLLKPYGYGRWNW